jgi:drug/metabolite transporter (DMT)-like permease
MRDKIAPITGYVLLVTGAVLLAIKTLSTEYIDTNGVLHEKFFLLPLGFSFLFLGFIILVIFYARNITKKNRKSKL